MRSLGLESVAIRYCFQLARRGPAQFAVICNWRNGAWEPFVTGAVAASRAVRGRGPQTTKLKKLKQASSIQLCARPLVFPAGLVAFRKLEDRMDFVHVPL
jgi:hypothetical protein